MEDRAKRLIIVLGAGCVLFFILALLAYSGILRQKQEWQKEKVARFNLEEKMGKFNQEKAELDSQVKSKDKELAQAKSELDSVKKSLQQEETISLSLKEELSKEIKAKEALEDELGNSRAKSKKTKMN